MITTSLGLQVLSALGLQVLRHRAGRLGGFAVRWLLRFLRLAAVRSAVL